MKNLQEKKAKSPWLCCTNPHCDGKKHDLLGNRTLCEYEKHE